MSVKPWKSKQTKTQLSAPWLYFLTTGQYAGLRDVFRDITSKERVDIFRAANPSSPRMREALREIWTQHGDEILATCKGKKRPWVETYLNV